MLTRKCIIIGLQQLGINEGDRVLVHSSMAALGPVDGGADTVIEALLEAVGSEGLIAVPTFAGPQPFNRKSTPTSLGAVAEHFWRRPEALRSSHPTHSVAAIGRGAAELVKDHENAPTGYAEGTPYYELAMSGGKVLLLGCDQDRNTTLHAAEAIAGAPYLKDVKGTYVDDAGKEITIPIAAMAGPHRDFIGLDRLFRETGVMRIGRIGSAVCRLMDGKLMLETAIDAMRRDMAAVLCDNPACADCIMQRGKIKSARLAGESFTLAAVAGDISDAPGEIISALEGEGIGAVEIASSDYARYGKALEAAGIKIIAVRSETASTDCINLASKLGVPLIITAKGRAGFDLAVKLLEQSSNIWIENSGMRSSDYAELFTSGSHIPGLAFNPGQFARAGEKPFLQVFYKGPLRKQTVHFYADDATFDGDPALPGQGNGEVKEIISMLRCRNYDGIITLRSHNKDVSAFREAAAAFWKLLDTM